MIADLGMERNVGFGPRSWVIPFGSLAVIYWVIIPVFYCTNVSRICFHARQI